MKKIFLLALLAGCSEVRIPSDAAPDAPISCVAYANVIGAALETCDWRSWSCAAPPSSAQLDACRARVLALEAAGEATCEAVRVETEGCR